jgi:hypothetical protein
VSWSDLGKSGVGEFILRVAVEAACKHMLLGPDLRPHSLYDLWVTQFELSMDSACNRRADQHRIFYSVKELLTEALLDLYPVVIEKEKYPEPYVQFQKMSGRVVEMLKLYCKTQAREGSVLRLEYARDCGNGNRPQTESIHLPLETRYRNRSTVLRGYYTHKWLEDELLDVLVNRGLKGLKPVIERIKKLSEKLMVKDD